jgi:hypothetical protein
MRKALSEESASFSCPSLPHHILFKGHLSLKHHLHPEKPGLLGKMADGILGQGRTVYIQEEFGIAHIQRAQKTRADKRDILEAQLEGQHF